MAVATRVTLAGGIGLMLARGLIVLATMMALLGVPASVSAAGNELSAAQASPGSGSTTTVFTFKVKYEGKFPALSVTASVAGRALAMTRVSGSALGGTWMASSTLPAGTWPVTFTASPERGNAPSLSGPTVKVAPAATPPPTAAPKPPPTPEPAPVATPAPPPRSGTETHSGTATTPAPAPAAPAAAPGESTTPRDNDGETTPAGGTPDDSDTDNGSAPGDDGADGADGAPAGGEPEHDGGVPVASSGSADGPAGESPDGAPTVGSASLGPDEDSAASSDGLLTTVLFAGLSGVAAVALIGTALMLAGRRRARDDEPGVPVGAMAGPNSEASPASPAAGDILGRRMLRQARVRMTDDPIVAALGIGNEDDDRRRARRKAGQVGRGPGERPNIGRH